MRLRTAIGLAVGSAAAGAGAVACGDLFHSTNDVLTACELDAQTDGCGKEASVEAGVEAGTDFCAWPEDQARRNAEHACAWLGACESPLGRNAFGSCMFEALLAFDCGANPNHRVKGRTHDRWDCLWQAETCAQVHACVFPQGSQTCAPGPTFVGCASEGGINADTRVECLGDGGTPPGENCALWGQTCGGNSGVGVCGGSTGQAALSCSSDSCDDSQTVHKCDDAGVDIGIDCTTNGAGRCSGFPTPSSAKWVACLPDSDAGACTASKTATCDGGIAFMCPAGVAESINCLALLDDVNACTPGDLWPEYDWTSPCVVTGDAGDAGSAGSCTESCGDAGLLSCYRGASFPLDCKQVGLGACHVVATDVGAVQNVACSRPP